jgi:hypothetical protein
LGAPQSDHAPHSRRSHRDERCKRAIGTNEAMVVFDSLGDGSARERRCLAARPSRSRRNWRFGVRSTRGLRSWSGRCRDRTTHTRSARSGHRHQDSATPAGRVRHVGLRSDLS